MWFSSFKVSNYVDVPWLSIYQPKVLKTTGKRPKMKSVLPIPVADISPPLFALIIGINRYKSLKVTTLRGAVADADSVKAYLENDLKVQKSNIRNLRDAQATRAAIISEFSALATNPDIKPGDPILIYYAGHGGGSSPPIGWEAGGADSKTQMLIPHDYNTKIGNREVYGIPDRTLNALLTRLAKAKGDNITVIFDCCHSGSGTRTDKTDQTHLFRGFEIIETVPAELDKNIWGTLGGGRGTSIPPGFLQSGLRSHVLLAACGAKEKAKEECGRGIFTNAVLEVLKAVSADTVTYTNLLQRIHALPEQNPQCEGVNQARILFNAKAPSTGRVFYGVHKEGDQYVLDAGAAHGINRGAEFAVYSDRLSSPKTSPLGNLAVKEVGPFTADMRLPDNASAFVLVDMGYAIQTRTGEEEDLRLHIAPNDTLAPIFEALGQDMLLTDSNRRRISLVKRDKAELDVAIDNEGVIFNILNPQVTQFGLNQLPFRVDPTYDAIYPVVRASAHYYWHLRRNSTSRVLENHIQLDFRKLKELEEYDEDFNLVLEPVGDNLNVAGIVDLVVNPDDMYGIKLVNTSDLDLYPSLFFFDNSDLSISSYYQPPTSAQILDVPLPKMTGNVPGTLSIGYGSGGSAPFSHFLRDGQDIDVGFLKLFLTTEPVNYSNIPQSSPFRLFSRGSEEDNPKASLIWYTTLVAVVQRRAPLAVS